MHFHVHTSPPQSTSGEDVTALSSKNVHLQLGNRKYLNENVSINVKPLKRHILISRVQITGRQKKRDASTLSSKKSN